MASPGSENPPKLSQHIRTSDAAALPTLDHDKGSSSASTSGSRASRPEAETADKRRSHTLPSQPSRSAIVKTHPRTRQVHRSFPHPTLKNLNMSGFFSSEAERALMGQDQNPQLWLGEEQMMQETTTTPYVDEESNWAHAHTSDSGFDYFHPLPPFSGTAYPPMTSSPAFMNYTDVGFPAADPSIPYAPSTSSMSSAASSHYAQTSLSVPSTGSSSAGPSSRAQATSRSPSPHPSDLYNYGNLNADNRTWRCAYPGCHSKAMFVRPCDLRKHFHRHNKQFFCRHEGCPQSREGGFSSKKDRARHESKHNPGVQCEWDGCERIFSRVDNMRNHMQRSECILTRFWLPLPF